MSYTRPQLDELSAKIERNAFRRALIESGAFFFLRKTLTPDRLINALLLVKTAQMIRSCKTKREALRHFNGANVLIDNLKNQ